MNAPKEILIIGGGFAGLAAGVELADKGHHVTLIERRGHLGGRAYSFRDPVSGSVMDNGQHILMGCYRDTLAFLEKIGTIDRVAFQKNLAVDYAGPGIGSFRFQTLPLPNPFNLLAGFFLFRGLSWKDKISMLRLGRFLKKNGTASSESRAKLDKKSITEWLNELGQTKRIQERFWDPLTLAALNDRPEVSSALLFEAVLREALFSGRKGARIGIPKTGLSDLYVDAARAFIEARGGTILLKTSVSRLHFRGYEFQEAELEGGREGGGRRISPEILLVTVPFTVLKKLLPEELLYHDPFFAPLSHLRSSPIVAINLWFDREVVKSPFVGFWGTKCHWLFNKGNYVKDGVPYTTLVISGAREELQQPGPQLIEMAMKELISIYPEAAQAKLLRSTVSKEPEATMAPAVGSAGLRLSQKTPYRNFFLAGDWTDTGLPATIESAVRSAKKAVELIDLTG